MTKKYKIVKIDILFFAHNLTHNDLHGLNLILSDSHFQEQSNEVNEGGRPSVTTLIMPKNPLKTFSFFFVHMFALDNPYGLNFVSIGRSCHMQSYEVS